MIAKSMLQQIDNLKKQINALYPLPQEILDQLKQYFRIGLTYSSNALEGNSLTEVETKIVITETDAPHGCFQTLFFCSMATP